MPVTTLYNFFASTRLAIILLSCIIAGAIAGTILPQFSDTFTYNLYNSWWFIFLLGLLSTNLIICSIERWPTVWKQIQPTQAAIQIEQLRKWPHQATWLIPDTKPSSLTRLCSQLSNAGWKKQRTNSEADSSCHIYQKGKFTRLGTLLVHSSILIILIGGAIGKIYGFKSYISLPEQEQISSIVSEDKTKLFNLGFAVRCDSFFIDRYPSGAIKGYGSRLSFIENGDVTETHTIHVNSPYKYKGITFYQSDFEGYNSFIFSVVNADTGSNTTLTAPFQKQIEWKDEGIYLGVINAELVDESVTRFKLWFKGDATVSVQRWMVDNSTLVIASGETKYVIHAKQLYATGIQVSKDPGVLLVYTGFVFLLAGLIITFFMSHKRVALYFKRDARHCYLCFSGTSNKHPEIFQETFNKLAETFHK